MKLVIWTLMFILFFSFVSAEVKVSCESDSECYLINEDSYCSKGYCYSHDQGYLTIEDFHPKDNIFSWKPFSVEPKTYRCDNCLMLAPENDNWFTQFIDWFLFVK